MRLLKKIILIISGDQIQHLEYWPLATGWTSPPPFLVEGAVPGLLVGR